VHINGEQKFRNEWLVFGAHFDVAPPVNGVLLDPHIIGERTYGTRVGAYDNTAGTSMVMETAKALADFESRELWFSVFGQVKKAVKEVGLLDRILCWRR
jgi:acetylornithine deacetylase/succinyl-diaminopimelate desuccinylase-like protein